MNDESISQELNLLLDNYWILKSSDAISYYKVKRRLRELRDIANNKLGCDIICNSKLIKLEKLPIKNSNTYKIDEFDEQLDYVLYMVLLLFLEDKALDEQFILSSFTEYTTNILSSIEGSIKPNWNKYKDRKSLVDVLKYATKLGIIRLRDGNDSKYADNIETEALYENTTLSHYIVRNFKFDIFGCQTVDDFLQNEKMDLDIVNKKRFITYRGFLFYPNIILSELEQEVSQYIRNMRGRIGEDIESFIDGEFILSKNMGFVSLESSSNKDLFPNYRRVISDIVLLINQYLEDYVVDNNDQLQLTLFDFKKLLEKIHEENKMYFSKEYREMPLSKLMEVIISFMESFDLLKLQDELVIINPICFLINGKYPERKDDKEENINYDIFSMMDEEV